METLGAIVIGLLMFLLIFFLAMGIGTVTKQPYRQGAIDVTTGVTVCHQWEVTDEWHCGPAEVVQ